MVVLGPGSHHPVGEGADELVFLDITASHEGRKTMVDVVKSVAEKVFMPFTVGGGISTNEDIRNLLNAGCDKVSINTSAVKRPEFIKEASDRFGAQCIDVAVDAKRLKEDSWEVYITGGRESTGIDVIEWVKKGADEEAFKSDIKPIVDAAIKHDPSISNLRKGNMMARIRMMLLYDFAKKHQGLVLGTENKTENILGYFTRFGDEASDIEPLLGLYKTQVRQLASFLDVPERIIIKSPSAGFWKGQTDEKEYGFTYEEADKVLHLHVDQHKSKEEIIRKGFDKETVEKVVQRLKDNEFKHKLPYTTVRKH